MKKYTLSQLEGIFEKLDEIYNNFKKYRNDRLIQTVCSADGTKMDVYIPLNAVPHLLGINTDYYKTVFTTRENSAQNIFEEMLDRGAYSLYSNMDKLDIDRLISPYILNKLENFAKIIRINSDDIEFICHYNKQKSYGITDNIENCDHIIVSKLDNGKYSYVTFSDNEYGSSVQAVPRSNQLFDSIDELYEKIIRVLARQSITIPTYISSYDKYSDEYKFRWFLPEDKKKEKALNALEYAKKLELNLDVTYDYVSSLGFSGRKTKMHKENNDTLGLITSVMKKGNVIFEKDLKVESFDYISDELVALIEAYNNTIVSKTSNSDTPVVDYSAMRREINNLNKKIFELSDRIEELESENLAAKKRYIDSEAKLSKCEKKLTNIKVIINE